jgi:acyl-coenzyme A thioesterase PaaI-like protein
MQRGAVGTRLKSLGAIFSRRSLCQTGAARPMLGGMDYDRFKQSIKYAIPFTAKCFSPQVLVLEAGYIRTFVPYRESYRGANDGSMHSAAFTVIVDHLGGFTAWSMLSDPTLFVNTVDLSFNFLRPFPVGNVVIDTKCVDIGRKLAFIESRIYSGKPAANGVDVGKKNNTDPCKEPDQLLATSFMTFNIYKLSSKKATTDFGLHVTP